MINSFFHVVTNNEIERELIESLVIETVQISGTDVLYVPIETMIIDPILREPLAVRYQKSYTIEAYMPDNAETEGGQELMEKFGIRFDKRMELMISRKRFIEEVGLPSPREGDLIYIGNPNAPREPNGKSSFMNILLEIRSVEYQSPEWTLGTHFTFKLTLEAYQYNSEKFDTGIPALDQFDPDSPNPHPRIEQLSEYQSKENIIEEADKTLVKFSRKNPLTGI